MDSIRIKKTMIISAFPGCGKTWLDRHKEEYGYSTRDSDSSTYKKENGWEKTYVRDIIKEAVSGKYDFIFMCQHQEVLSEMDRRGVPYVTVYPDNIVWNTNESKERMIERQLIKQQWFGRFILRDNSHIKDFVRWVQNLIENYDDWTSLEHIKMNKQTTFFVLNQSQYLSNIINDLYFKKENYTSYNDYSKVTD